MTKRLIDLSFGNPEFLQPYWTNVELKTMSGGVTPGSFMDYPKYGGMELLKQEILHLHALAENVSPAALGYSVVIGAGATQILFAAMAAMQKKHKSTRIRVPHPMWFRFDEMIRIAGLTPEKLDDLVRPVDNSLALLTVPNNPDNSLAHAERLALGTEIYDCSYLWPQYTAFRQLDRELMVFSLAKATGHAGTRIGWALVKDADLAAEMGRHIEIISGGVSLDAQWRATRLISDQSMVLENTRSLTTTGKYDGTVFRYGKKVLQERWKQFESALNDSNLYGDAMPTNHSGMFVWGSTLLSEELPAQWWGKIGVVITEGPKCGGQEHEYRLSIGCSEDKFQELIRRIKAR